eukprot:TRINITY_DN2691_c1_g1_i7.p1 TRINITY_DN2691_c1_g1~~TRINITY_DN2691_c1_g1_i7.p1  ORF type:complete len:507 (+),score=25.55 TRINITY_DN2691_c1_g1_i7:82-1602(+)
MQNQGKKLKNTEESKISLLTGILGATFTLSQFFTAYPWGVLSDKIGRKIILQIGNTASMLSILMLGFSEAYVMACLVRFFGGLLNGVISMNIIMVGERFRPEQQTRAMGVMSFGWAAGVIVGPGLGGLLSFPCTHYAHKIDGCEVDGLFRKLPFVLPCVFAAVGQFIAILSTHFFLIETRNLKLLQDSLLDETESNREEDMHMDRDDTAHLPNNYISQLLEKNIISNHQIYQQSGENSSQDIKTPLLQNLILNKSPNTQFQPCVCDLILDKDHKILDINDEHNDFDFEQRSTPWYNCKIVRTTIFCYGAICFVGDTFQEVVPVFAQTSTQLGGLGISLEKLSIPLVVCGTISMINSVFFVPKITQVVGITRTAKWVLFIGAVFIIILPVSSLTYNSITSILILILCMGIWELSISTTFICTLVMMNGVCTQKNIGSVNGFAQMIAAFARGVGPFLGGLLYAFTVHIMISGHQFFVFIILSGIIICITLMYRYLYMFGLDKRLTNKQ